MSTAVEYFGVVMTGVGTVYEAIRPYKEALFGICLILGGGTAAFKLGYTRQARRPEEALSEAANTAGRSMVTRLHVDDRQAFIDLTDGLTRMTRAVRELCTAMQDQSDTCHRAGRRRGDEA